MRGTKILIVDDDPDIVLYLSSFLEDNGYEVASAEDAPTALSVAGAFLPDAILIDVLLPGQSGLGLLVSLRKDPRWQDVPLVVVTGRDRILQDECQSYLGTYEGVRGPDGVLGKPVERDTLLAVLRHLPDPGDDGNGEI